LVSFKASIETVLLNLPQLGAGWRSYKLLITIILPAAGVSVAQDFSQKKNGSRDPAKQDIYSQLWQDGGGESFNEVANNNGRGTREKKGGLKKLNITSDQAKGAGKTGIEGTD